MSDTSLQCPGGHIPPAPPWRLQQRTFPSGLHSGSDRSTGTNCMERRPSWEADSHSAGQEIPRTLCNPKSHYCLHKIQFHTLRLYFFTNLPSTLKSLKWSLPMRFPTKMFHAFLIFPCVLHIPSISSSLAITIQYLKWNWYSIFSCSCSTRRGMQSAPHLTQLHITVILCPWE
jgi:hypothetical protein